MTRTNEINPPHDEKDPDCLSSSEMKYKRFCSNFNEVLAQFSVSISNVDLVFHDSLNFLCYYVFILSLCFNFFISLPIFKMSKWNAGLLPHPLYQPFLCGVLQFKKPCNWDFGQQLFRRFNYKHLWWLPAKLGMAYSWYSLFIMQYILYHVYPY